MTAFHRLLAALVGCAAVPALADCTLVAEAATRRILKQEGDCDVRITPASTFKIAISLMGYDVRSRGSWAGP